MNRYDIDLRDLPIILAAGVIGGVAGFVLVAGATFHRALDLLRR